MNTTATAKKNIPYDQIDFKIAYEKLYDQYQHLQKCFQQALKRIEYLEAENKKLKADNAYLKKMLFAEKTEKRKKKLHPQPQTISQLAMNLL